MALPRNKKGRILFMRPFLLSTNATHKLQQAPEIHSHKTNGQPVWLLENTMSPNFDHIWNGTPFPFHYHSGQRLIKKAETEQKKEKYLSLFILFKKLRYNDFQ